MKTIQLETFSFNDSYYHSHGLVEFKEKGSELGKLICKLNLFTPQGIQPITLAGDDITETIGIYISILRQISTEADWKGLESLRKKLMEKYSH